jgi:nicotinamidase-related amidase
VSDSDEPLGRRASSTAVLVIDMLNAYRHEDAELLVPNVADIIDPLSGLIAAVRERDNVDLIYTTSPPIMTTSCDLRSMANGPI